MGDNNSKFSTSVSKKQSSDLRQKVLDAIDIRRFFEKETSQEINAGSNGEALILCVFHEDKDASLSVNISTGMFHCFGCNESGSLFDFYMKRHGVDFKTALHALAAEAGIESETNSHLPKKKHKPFLKSSGYPLSLSFHRLPVIICIPEALPTKRLMIFCKPIS